MAPHLQSSEGGSDSQCAAGELHGWQAAEESVDPPARAVELARPALLHPLVKKVEKCEQRLAAQRVFSVHAVGRGQGSIHRGGRRVREHTPHLAQHVVDWSRGHSGRGRTSVRQWRGVVRLQQQQEQVRKQGQGQVRVVAQARLARQEQLGA
jgi:hypothetical protein